MLLIGSRAILHHFPEFRPPRDWDLVGTEEDIARLDRLLPRNPLDKPGGSKTCYTYHGVLVEVANGNMVPYWGSVREAFADGPSIEDPVLGKLAIPPAGFLLLTKQCGLIYQIGHWHKNLEDLYFLRDRVASIPEHVAAFLPHALSDSRRMFAEQHRENRSTVESCHPEARGLLRPELHRTLHDRLKLGELAAVDEPRAWEGFPGRAGATRRERMIDLFAEETQVLAAERFILPSATGKVHPEGELTRWALRTLITSTMPEGLRYFGVNYYREIMDRVPQGFLSRIADIESPQPLPPSSE